MCRGRQVRDGGAYGCAVPRAFANLNPGLSMVFVFCTKFGSNIYYSHWNRRTYVSDIHLMTSRELTSGFDFWSRGHLCMALMHLPMKFGADIFIQSGVIDIFFKIKDGGHKENKTRKKEKKTLANWLFAQTTHDAVLKWKFACRVASSV